MCLPNYFWPTKQVSKLNATGFCTGTTYNFNSEAPFDIACKPFVVTYCNIVNANATLTLTLSSNTVPGLKNNVTNYFNTIQQKEAGFSIIIALGVIATLVAAILIVFAKRQRDSHMHRYFAPSDDVVASTARLASGTVAARINELGLGVTPGQAAARESYRTFGID